MGTDSLTNRPFGSSAPIRRPMLGSLPPLPIRQPLRRKVFLSYSHHDQIDVNRFVADFGGSDGVLIPKMVGRRSDLDRINSTNSNYVMQKIRSDYLQDSTVTIVLVGTCTHSRRYVDWEIKASLQQGEDCLPNGLIAIQMPSSPNGADLPPRLLDNWSAGHFNCYARYWRYPKNGEQLRQWIEDGFAARTTRAVLIQNPQDMMSRNAVCHLHCVTH